jgi:hypothetical protein
MVFLRAIAQIIIGLLVISLFFAAVFTYICGLIYWALIFGGGPEIRATAPQVFFDYLAYFFFGWALGLPMLAMGVVAHVKAWLARSRRHADCVDPHGDEDEDEDGMISARNCATRRWLTAAGGTGSRGDYGRFVNRDRRFTAKVMGPNGVFEETIYAPDHGTAQYKARNVYGSSKVLSVHGNG